MDKRKITLTVIVIAVLLVVLVGSTYAYWTLNGTLKTSANVQVQTGGLILRLDDTEGSITTNDVIDPNHLSFSKYFNITNESAADGYAKVLFKGLTNTFVTDALVYDLEEVQSDKTSYTTPRMIITNEVVPKVSNSNATLADGLLIEKGTLSGNTVTPNTKYYKITVRYKYSDTVNQNKDLNKTLVSGFTLEEGQPSVSMTVSFNTMDNSITNPESKTITSGQVYGKLPRITKTGYYMAWYSDNLYTERIKSNSITTKKGNHTLYGKWVESPVPVEYILLENIQSTGTQYIDAKFIPNQNTGFEADFEMAEQVCGSLFATRTSWNSGADNANKDVFELTTFTETNRFPNGIISIGKNKYDAGLIYNSRIFISLKNGVYTKPNGATINIDRTAFTSPKNLLILALNSIDYGYIREFGIAKIYSLKFYDGTTLIRNYYPVERENNGVKGLYDTVTNEFYINNSTTGSDFTAGVEA